MAFKLDKKIIGINFGLFSPEEIKKTSVVHVIHPETIENGVPKENGLIDLRMGTTEKNFLCQTCNENMFDCVGHFGHIELCKPMFHIGYITKIKKLLECICFYCSKIKDFKLLKEKTKNYTLEEAWNILKTKTFCDSENEKGEKIGCCNKQPIIKKEGMNLIAFMKGNDDEGKVILNGEKVCNIFKKIDASELKFIGFNVNSRPENMLITVLLVTPPSVRPSILTDGLRSEDDLTHKYADIVKSNACLKKYEQDGAPNHIIRDYEQLLQFHLSTLINNEISGQPIAMQKSGRPIKSISARLKGKEGRIRGNLMGKRVDFSARSVITPDPAIELDEVGVPLHIAMIQTFPEKVNSININTLQKMVNNGPTEYPGANYVIRNDGQRIDLKYSRFDLKLEKGFIVERHMLDNDIVLFNRQPSLHKMSMMGHRAKIMNNKTFRLNLSVTSPYNADFDGDEMNLHMPQSYNTKSELINLASVSRNIISPQSNKPVIGIVQDTLVGVRLFTLKNTFFNKRETMNLLFTLDTLEEKVMEIINNPILIIHNKISLWSGLQIFSAVFPNKFNFNYKGVVIKNSNLITGTLSKITCGATHGGLIHVICNDYGCLEATKFINNVQRLINHFMFHINSFTIGIGDTIINPEIIEDCKSNIANAIHNVDELINMAKLGKLEKLPGLTIENTFESKVNLILNKVRDYKGEITLCNNMNAMILSGSKGSKINIAQMTSCVGQQNVEGKRIPFGFEKRTLPHFQKFDYSAISRGFISNSYLTGMTPQEFYFHAMGGREGLIDTAIKTAETGYIQRRLVKAMEDAVVRSDSSVRNGFGKIYQFAYGEDGFNGKILEKIILNKPTKDEFYIDINDITNTLRNNKSFIPREVIELLKTDVEIQKLNNEYYNYLEQNYSLLDNGMYVTPVNIQRILLNKKLNNRIKCNLSPYIIYDEIEKLKTNNLLWNYYVSYSLNPKKLLQTQTKSNFMEIVNTIKIKLKEAQVEPNEMVGTLAAQSVGEPATQMTLNTFHLAGVASTITMGVPRLNEIINTTKNIKTPLMIVQLQKNDLQSCKNLRNKIEYSSLKDLYESFLLLYDPIITDTILDEDKELVENYFEMPDEIDLDKCSSFCIRFELNKYHVIGRGLDLEYIIEKIKLNIKSMLDIGIHIIYSLPTDEKLILRIRLILNDKIKENLKFYNELVDKLLNIHIQGLEGIKKAYLIHNKDDTWTLQTDGINYQTILSFPNVDGSHTTSNDLFEIYETLGVEALRETIMTELTMVIENNGSYVNSRHLSLLSDVMTVCGYPSGITRHGVNREIKASALKRASFEETVDILLEAAATAEENPAHGITENIMMGQLAPLGTGNIQLILDIKKLDQIVNKAFINTVDKNLIMLNSPAFTEALLIEQENCILSEDIGLFSPEHEELSDFNNIKIPEYNDSPNSEPNTYNSLNTPISSEKVNNSVMYTPNSFYFNQQPESIYFPGTNGSYFAASGEYFQSNNFHSNTILNSGGYQEYMANSNDYDNLSQQYKPIDSPKYNYDNITIYNYSSEEEKKEEKE